MIEHNTLSKPGWLSRYRWLWMLMLLAMGGLAFAQWVTQPRWSLDLEAAKRLTPEQRAEFDEIFFYETWSWTLGSFRYPAPNATEKRLADLERMAKAGYVPAQAWLRELSRRSPTVDVEMWEQLKRLAADGDPSVTCAVSVVWIANGAGALMSEAQKETYVRAIVRGGAQRGLPECLATIGPVVELEPALKLKIEVFDTHRKAAYGGSARGAFMWAQWIFATVPPTPDVLDVALCWSSFANRYQPSFMQVAIGRADKALGRGSYAREGIAQTSPSTAKDWLTSSPDEYPRFRSEKPSVCASLEERIQPILNRPGF